MADLKNTEIGGFKVVLKPVPASKARKIQTTLLAIIAEPLADALGQQSEDLNVKNINDISKRGKQMLMGLKGLAGILPKLNDGQLDEIIDICKPFILIDGKPFNEDDQFDATTLMAEYEIIWYFLNETFGDFIDAARSRFNLIPMTAASSKQYQLILIGI